MNFSTNLSSPNYKNLGSKPSSAVHYLNSFTILEVLEQNSYNQLPKQQETAHVGLFIHETKINLKINLWISSPF